MRLRYLIPVLLIAGVAVGGAVTAHAAGDRQRTFADAAAHLRAQWDRDQSAGVPASSLAPLRADLAAQAPAETWWSPGWIQDDRRALLDRLTGRTQSAWMAALAGEGTQADGVIAQWTSLAAQQSTWLAADAVASATQWPAQLAAASTPAAIAALVSTWKAFLAEQQTAIVSAQQARLAAELRSAGGPQAVLATARRLVNVANSANLDPGDVASLAAQMSGEIASNNADALATAGKLLVAVGNLQSLINLNDQVNAQVLPLLFSVDQAGAEGTPNAHALASQQSAIAAQFRAARTADQVSAVARSMTALQSQVSSELAANLCGHQVGSGKVITISLSLQEMVFYQDGCVAKATPVSTGRPQLRTPTGSFWIFYKKTPFTFISPWPPSSPFYYFPSPVSWVMEFASGGYFIHDAPWESPGQYGPGSQNNLSAASHGCVHTPTAVMKWAFSWTPTGTRVLISA